MTSFASYFPITDPTLIFCVVLMIILFAPIIMGKLRIPYIIGMVLAGMLIGKYGFNILERDSSFELFGKVGLLYIMFLAGLEMDLESVKKNSKRFCIFGLLTCLGTTYPYLCDGNRIIGLLPTGIFPLRMYHGIQHPDSLPYRRTLWTATPLQCHAQRRIINALFVPRVTDACRISGIL